MDSIPGHLKLKRRLGEQKTWEFGKKNCVVQQQRRNFGSTTWGLSNNKGEIGQQDKVLLQQTWGFDEQNWGLASQQGSGTAVRLTYCASKNPQLADHGDVTYVTLWLFGIC